MKIGPVDTEMAFLIVKKEEEIMEGKIYSPFGHLAERAKKEDVSFICNSIPTIWCKDCKNRSSGS